MILQDKEIEINNIWADDKLNRKRYADFLYQVIVSAETSEDEDNALIFSIDGEWGAGKSFFINRWMRDLEAKGHLVSRFDAWKNDIVDEPLVGFLSHVYADFGEWDKRGVATVIDEKIKQSQKLLLPLAKELLKGAAIKGLGTLVTDETAKEVVKAIVEGHDKVTEDDAQDEQSMSSMLIHRQLQAHNKNLQLIEDFKKKLSETAKVVTENGGNRFPVFIFIDELDRCRPDYAVRLLEVVKHIFNSRGICFISSVNINQLKESIRTIYGSNFEADRYLDRFFNHRLKLPAPTIKNYIFSLKDFRSVRDSKARLLSDSNKYKEDTLIFYSSVCHLFDLDLRVIKSIFSRLIICMKILNKDGMNFHHDEILFVILTLIKVGKFNGRDVTENLRELGEQVNKLSYHVFVKESDSYTTNTRSWGDFIKSFRNIYNISRNTNVRNLQIDHYDYIYCGHVVLSFNLNRGQESEVFTKLNKYLEVCEMSGRLEA